MAGIVSLIFSKFGFYAALVAGFLCLWCLNNAHVRASTEAAMDAKAATAIAAQSAADQVRLTAAQKALSISEKTRIAETQHLRDKINAQTPKSGWRLACPALGIAIDGMHGASGPVATTANPR